VKKLKAAIIGGGNSAETVHVPYYRSREELQLTACVSPNAERVKSFADRNGIPHHYTNAAEMLEKERPDIVSVCTPNRFHYEYVMMALNSGCHVMCEKPPAITSEQAKQMKEAAEKNDRILAYNFHHRFAEDVKLIKEKVAEGVLGDVYITKVKALRRSGIPGWGHFTNKEMQGGGPLIDIGIHMLDAAMHVLNYPKIAKVTAKMYKKIGNQKSEGSFGKWDPSKYEVEDSLFGFIELEGGGLLQLETSFALNMKETSIMNVEFFGDQAGATLFPAEIYTDNKGELSKIFEKEAADSERSQKSMAAFVDRCLGENVMVAHADEGYAIQKLVEALYKSAEKGECISL
jgi:predicted dehydrogenase